MAVVRILLVSILAAIAACGVASLILYGNIERASFAPLFFALPSSLLLLATVYAALAEQGIPLIGRYVALIAVGVVGGGIILGFISAGDARFTIIGSFYGFTTATCWIVLHALSRFWSRTGISDAAD